MIMMMVRRLGEGERNRDGGGGKGGGKRRNGKREGKGMKVQEHEEGGDKRLRWRKRR